MGVLDGFGIRVLMVCLILHAANGFYLPGSYPHRYLIGDYLYVKVNSLTSIDTEMPFSYYSLPFCKPQDGVKDSRENLGEILMGDRIENSPYKFPMHKNQTEIFLCRSPPLSTEDFNLLKKRIDEMYQVNLILDNLPAIRYTKKDDFLLHWTGYPVGVRVQDVYYMFNHLKFTVLVHKYEETNVARVMGTGDAAEVIPPVTKEESDAPGYMVVGFEVVPCSFQHDPEVVKDLKMYDKYPAAINCDPATVANVVKEGQPLIFSYEVSFVESDIKWPSRWDAYLKMEGAKVHWFSILNSLMVIAFLAGIVFVILLRTVRRDLTKYEELDKEAQAQMNEELSGWKLVVGDVFRAPTNSKLLCVLIGDGVQILGMAIVTILFAALGFMSPASRGTLITGMENLIAPILDIVKVTWGPAGRRIGYIKNLKKNIEELNDSAMDLFVLRNDVQNGISTSISKVATCECDKWLGDVKLAEDEVNDIKAESREEKKCLGGWCPNVYYSMKLGKRVEESKERIIKLIDKRKKFEGREMVAAPWKKFVRQSVQTVDTSSTTELTLQKILESIEDVEVQKVGIVGMGGVGKTLTMKLLNNRLGESQTFEIIIFVTVSGEGNERKVQNDIADRLEFPSSNESDDRLKETIHQFLEGKKFLLLLDDVWKKIDLLKIGIPVVNQDKGCKVVLTTRDIVVCRQMETNVNIQIEKLSEEDAWSLFNEKVQDVAMSSHIEPIARGIVKKCDGLPLAIIVIGSSLRNNSNVAVWRNTRAELESSQCTCEIKGMEEEVFSCLRISYKLLPKCERKLFLYCSLYPEDYEIVITELAEYCWLEGYIQGDTIEKARDKGCHMVCNLVGASLLESGSHEKYIKMHDIVRLFALNEASRLQSQKMLLVGCSLKRLLDWPNWRTLSTLVLQNNNQVTMILDSLFESMHGLRLLDLSWTDIKSLPSTLCNLINLRGLYLRGCNKLEELPTQVGELKGLEVLDLGYSTAIRYLPTEVGKLTCLKRLIVGFQYRNCCQKDTEQWDMKLRVPTGIIQKLPFLEELSLYVYDFDKDLPHYFERDCVEEGQWDNKSMEIVVEELCTLERLTYLDAYFPKVECLEHFLHHRKSLKASRFGRFRFRVGTEKDSWFLYCQDEEWDRSLVCKGGLGIIAPHAAIMETLAHCSFFYLLDHRTIRNLSELGLGNLNELKKCWVICCDKMETLFDGQETSALPCNLETLRILHLPKLRSLCDGPLLLRSLTHLQLDGCNNLKKVFQLAFIRPLCSLESLVVRNCLKMEEIIEIEEEEMSVSCHTHNVISYNDRVILPNIKFIELLFLPKLVNICRGFSNFEWPSLETIAIAHCSKLKSLSFLSNGTNIVAPALKKIDGKSEWWEALEWEDNDIKQRLQPFFSESMIW